MNWCSRIAVDSRVQTHVLVVAVFVAFEIG